MKLDLKATSLKFDDKLFNWEQYLPGVERDMHDIAAEHADKAGRGQRPDGTTQKQNSPGYRTRKANEGIRVGGQLRRGEVPTILTGRTQASRTTRRRGSEVETTFGGRGEIASHLERKGYKIHHFGTRDIMKLLKGVMRSIDKQIKNGIKELPLK